MGAIEGVVAVDKHTLAVEPVAPEKPALELVADATHVYFIDGNTGSLWAAPKVRAPR